MVDGDICGFLAKQGEREGVYPSAGGSGDENNREPVDLEAANDSGTEGGRKRDTYTATPGRKTA